MVMYINPEQPLNAESPMVVKVSGRMMDVSPVHPLNSLLPMAFVLPQMVMSVNLV